MIKLYNTLSRKKEVFNPIKKKRVSLYTCGPTVYWFAHIGNLRTYIFEDILKRVLEYDNYKVKHVMNITDVGHLTSDSDTGEDKMEKGARRDKRSAWDIAKFYTRAFKEDIKKLNINPADHWPKASQNIKEQIKLIKELEKKGYAYKIEDGIYFDTSKMKNYGKLAKKEKKELEEEGRVAKIKGKKDPKDFALWKFSPKDKKRQMEWNSPWGKGFPGWHPECVAMAVKYLDIPFDIHCGGIDHIPIHHTNEIAQVKAAFNKKMANYWIHGEFLNLKEGRMGKSKGNILTLKDLIDKNYNPLAFRYLCLGTHYRKELIFNLDILKSSQKALENLYSKFSEIQASAQKKIPPLKKNTGTDFYLKKFKNFVSSDLNTPQALALMWDLVKDDQIPPKAKKKTLLKFDEIFQLNLKKVKPVKIPSKIKDLAQKREIYRKKRNWKKADDIRKTLQDLGYRIDDTDQGPVIRKEE